MDNLVLVRVAAALDRELRGAVLREVREESHHRLRLIFAGERRTHSVALSLRPELPWIGRPAGRGRAARRRPGKFGAAVNRALHGAPIRMIEKPDADRRIRLCFADGRRLIVELATHGANLVLLDPEGRNVVCARRPRSARDQLDPGKRYRPPELPHGLLDPFEADAEEIDRLLEIHGSRDEPIEILRRRLFGVGTQGARLALAESARSGRSPGTVLTARLAALRRGEVDPVVWSRADPLEEAESGRLDLEATLLLPWEPPESHGDPSCRRKADAAATAGWYHEAVEQAAGIDQRLASLRALLRREIERLIRVERKVSADLDGFEDPQRYRFRAEALLAGLGRARKIGDAFLVPDPYDPSGAEIAVPARPGLLPQQVAEDLFRRHRRARRGLEQARERREALATRRSRLEEVAWRHAGTTGLSAVTELEGAMRAEGIPVGLEPDTRAGRTAALQGRPRLEGVRIYTSSDGLTVLVGKSAKDNQRLTFRLAAPDDFWLHAQGRPGAHVVVRNDRRRRRPPAPTLMEAAALAAWFSEARAQGFAEVQWTRRKYVRRPRGAPPGTVVLKRFETVRVRPALPPAGEDPSPEGD